MRPTARPVNRFARRAPLPCRSARRLSHDAPLPPRRRGSERPARPGGHGAPEGRGSALGGAWGAPEGRHDGRPRLRAGAASEGGRRDAARTRRQGGRGVGMGTHRRGSNRSHARDGTPKRAIASHARPALPSRLSLARRVGASGVQVQTPLPPPDWARHTAGGRQDGCLAARVLKPILPPTF